MWANLINNYTKNIRLHSEDGGRRRHRNSGTPPPPPNRSSFFSCQLSFHQNNWKIYRQSARYSSQFHRDSLTTDCNTITDSPVWSANRQKLNTLATRAKTNRSKSSCLFLSSSPGTEENSKPNNGAWLSIFRHRVTSHILTKFMFT
jgi:hypothetical protein